MNYKESGSIHGPSGVIIRMVLIIASLLTGCREDFQYDYTDTIDPEPVGGISAGYVDLFSPSYGVSIDQYTVDGKVILTFSTQAPDIRKGSIITVDLDTMGYLRRVIAVNYEDNKITLQTEEAYFNDLFVDKDFTLNTRLIPPGEVVDSKWSDEKIAKSLTDKNGHIHPFEIIYFDEDNNIRKRSASDLIIKSKVEDYNIIDFYEDFSDKDLYGKDGDNIHFYVDEGHVSLLSDAVFEFDFDYDGELDEDTKVKKGDLKSFSFYLDSKAEFVTKLALDMAKNAEESDKKKLINFEKVTAKFLVGAVPVWISVDCDIWGAYQFNSTASLNADWGFESIHTIKVGGTYNGETETFTPIKEHNPQNNIYPLNIKGDINASARLELFPKVDVLFYSFFGPFAEIIPFIEGNYTSAIRSQITPTGSKTFLAWNSNLDVGLDFRVGTKLTFLGLFGKEFGPTTLNCFNHTLWESPKNLEILTNLPQEAAVNTTIPISLIVKDNLGLPVPFCSVYFSGDGSFSNEMPITDMQGKVNTNWILDNYPGEKELSAGVYNALGELVDHLTFSVLAQGGSGPIADFDASPTVIFEGQSVQFTDLSTNSPTSWNWNFGDGGTSSDQNPTHPYSQAGDYTITLSVTNNFGSDTETKSNYIKVNPPDEENDIVFNPDLTYGTLSDVDGNTYKTIQIGEQIWMAENLRTTRLNNGLIITQLTSDWDWSMTSNPSYCWYGNNLLYKENYGGLYNWYAVNTGMLCPSGWHIPSEDEWDILANYLGEIEGRGGKLKEIGTFHWISPNIGATNETGFTALPGGFRDNNGYFDYIEKAGMWWTTTPSILNLTVETRALDTDVAYLIMSSTELRYGNSIRCIKDRL
jgi:uncharacterized protein (TIGR02145 family)